MTPRRAIDTVLVAPEALAALDFRNGQLGLIAPVDGSNTIGASIPPEKLSADKHAPGDLDEAVLVA